MERLERVARNMPVEKLAMFSIESKQGIVYFAYGTDGGGKIHGIWGHCGTGRTVEFKKDTSIDIVRKVLVKDAEGHIEQLIQKGLMSDAS